MTTLRRLAVVAGALGVAVLVAAAGSCSKKSPTAPSAGGLPGTWRATMAEFIDRSNPGVRIEVIARGVSIVLVLVDGGSFTLTTTVPGVAPEVETGTWTSSSDVLTLRRAGTSGDTQFDMTLSGDTLTLRGGHVLFDVDDDDVDEEAELNMTLARQ
jgi:hypothetical protein